MLTLIVIGFVMAKPDTRRVILFAIAAFVVLLGPTLLIPEHRQLLYLYAPHFFIALAIGSLMTGLNVRSAIPMALSCMLIVAPYWTHSRQNIVGFHLAKGETNRAQFDAAMRLLNPLEPRTTVFISGLEPFHNPFYLPGVSSLMTAFRDQTIKVVVERPEADLASEFCRTAAPKRFLRFDGPNGAEVTSAMQTRCRDEASS
jgi:hypothetical protein